MLQRNRFRGWLGIGLVLALPAVAIVGSVPGVRVEAIPPVPESSLSDLALRDPTDGERETEAMFERAVLLGRPIADFQPKEEPKPREAMGPTGPPGSLPPLVGPPGYGGAPPRGLR